MIHIAASEMQDTAAVISIGRADLGAQQHMQVPVVVQENVRIAKSDIVIFLTKIKALTRFGKVDTVLTDRVGDHIGGAVGIDRHGEGAEPALVKNDRSRAEACLHVVFNRDRHGVSRPMDEIGGGNMRPLMRPHTPFAVMVVPVL